jgi:protein tyrosine/serine phosphatase
MFIPYFRSILPAMRMTLLFVLLFCLPKAFAAGVQPNNFFQVDSQVLRGAALTQENVVWLQERGVKTIIKLDDENEAEASWGIPVERYHINKFGLNLSYTFAMQILEAIDEAAQRGPVYVHCEKGADRTGLMIALYRIQHGWSVDEARNEMNDPRFGHSALQVWMDYKFEQYAPRLAQEPLFFNWGEN